MTRTKKTKNTYTKQELKLFKQIEQGKLESAPKKKFEKEKLKFQKIANNTLKRKSINIRVFESDIAKIKAIAFDEGIPYQTFITSILHKVATGKILANSI